MKTKPDINSPARKVLSGCRGGNITSAGPSGMAFRSLWPWDWNANENRSHQVISKSQSVEAERTKAQRLKGSLSRSRARP